LKGLWRECLIVLVGGGDRATMSRLEQCKSAETAQITGRKA